MQIQVIQNTFSDTVPEFQKVIIKTENIEIDRLRKNKYALDLFHKGIWKYLASRIEVFHIYSCVDGLTNCWPQHTQLLKPIDLKIILGSPGQVLWGRAKSQTRLRRQVNINTLIRQSLTRPSPDQGFQRNSQGGCDLQNGWRKCNYATLKQNQIAKVCI